MWAQDTQLPVQCSQGGLATRGCNGWGGSISLIGEPPASGTASKGLAGKGVHCQGHWSKPGYGMWSQYRREIAALGSPEGRVAVAPPGLQLWEDPVIF